MLQLKYYSHLILNSKYSLFYRFALIFFIYFIMYGNKVIYCMNEGNNNPEITETITPEVSALMREIESFAGERADLLERIAQQENTIHKLQQDVEYYRETRKNLCEIYAHNVNMNEQEINKLQATLHNLTLKLDEYERVIDNLNHIIQAKK